MYTYQIIEVQKNNHWQDSQYFKLLTTEGDIVHVSHPLDAARYDEENHEQLLSDMKALTERNLCITTRTIGSCFLDENKQKRA